ncbi:MAG TPA: hypothetical protein VN836_07815 [Verrucomicrobiae bacterium]|nr:hypothetical protein [Verrucomicrobiae bacterium]
MARTFIHESASPYYPPRARWYSPLFYWGGAIRRRLTLDRINLPRALTLGGLVAGFLIPGLGIHLRSPKLWGRAAIPACGFLFFGFLVWFGFPAGNIAFGLLFAVHTIGFVYYCNPLFEQELVQSRLWFTLLTLVGLGLLIYLPGRNVILQHWLVPLRLNGHVMVVQRQFPAAAIQRGDWVAYRLHGNEEWGENAVYVRSGLGLGPTLALAGDRVEFSTNAFTVNGAPHPLLPHMPVSGGLIVPEKNWFVWPNVGISGHGVGEDRISSAMLQMAVVSENQYIGKPFKRWLWRQQIPL